jgi:hypothetical protein
MVGRRRLVPVAVGIVRNRTRIRISPTLHAADSSGEMLSLSLDFDVEIRNMDPLNVADRTARDTRVA